MSQYDSLPFVWTADVFGTNDVKMDEEHAGLFIAIDKLDAERTLASFESLAGLVVQHFEDEEQLGLSDAHKQIHKDLVAVAVEKINEVKNGTPVTDGLVDYLRNWLKNHIMGNDIPTYGK